jgi:hypothetical protein
LTEQLDGFRGADDLPISQQLAAEPNHGIFFSDIRERRSRRTTSITFASTPALSAAAQRVPDCVIGLAACH